MMRVGVAVLLAAIALLPSVGSACVSGGSPPLLFDEQEFLSLPAASFAEAMRRSDLPKSAFARSLQLPQGIDGPDCAASLEAQGSLPAVRAVLLAWVVDWRHQFPGNTRPLEGEAAQTMLASLPPRLRQVPSGLPAEFRLYFAGAMAYYSGELAAARASWQELLALPESARQQRTVWAEFMLAKTDASPQEAVRRFRSVRTLAAAGFADRLGLAFASLGEEARIELYQNKDFPRAIRLYAERHASSPNGETLASLRWASAEALTGSEDARAALVADPLSRKVVTAYVLSEHNQGSQQRMLIEQGQSWQRTVEKSGIEIVEGADKLAWAAYRGGDFEAANRWLERADNESALSMWVASKLAARAGNLEDAKELLARINVQELSNLTSSGEERICDERGAIEISLGQYDSALDSFREGNSWDYAAYVAESLMTIGELRTKVARLEVARPRDLRGDKPRDRDYWYWDAERRAENWPRLLRDLLVRRLRRASDFQSADEYPESSGNAKGFMVALAASKDLNLPRTRRADALFTAACILRVDGMELVGTELLPDMAIYSGQFPGYAMTSARANFRILRPGPDELERELKHRAAPFKRFHYRYVAAEMAWRAVDLLGRSDPETRAEYLYAAGDWLRHRDPEAADRFYKRLVRTCRGTELGKEAALRGWFPAHRSICAN